MSVTYKRPPLVEIIAEVRWGPGAPAGPGDFPVALPKPKDEEFFMHFGMLAASKGYNRFERLVPPGLPVPFTNVACRFRPTDVNSQSPLLQVGPTVFTANALAPNYTGWKTFSPVVLAGLEMLFEAHAKAYSGTPPKLTQCVVRYIDIFGDELTGGRSVQDFFSEVLKIDLGLPEPFQRISTSPIEGSAQFEVRLKEGVMNVSLGPASREGTKLPMLDTTVIIPVSGNPNIEATMGSLTKARGIIHDAFVSLTAPIHDAMEPM